MKEKGAGEGRVKGGGMVRVRIAESEGKGCWRR